MATIVQTKLVANNNANISWETYIRDSYFNNFTIISNRLLEALGNVFEHAYGNVAPRETGAPTACYSLTNSLLSEWVHI